jgi:lysophospholipase L1-like esterase
MLKQIILSVFCLLLIVCQNGHAQTRIENNYYSVQPVAGFQQAPAFMVTHKASKLKRTVVPRVQLVFTGDQPELTSSALDGQQGIVAWKTNNGVTQDISKLGSKELIAQTFQIKNNQLQFSFPDQPEARVSLIVKFVTGQQAPVFELGLQAKQTGNYSLGFTGMPPVDSADLDFVYQPLAWTWKRFPSRFALTEEAYANTAAVFTNHHGYTEGLAVSLASIPYRYAHSAQWNNAGKKDNTFWSVFPADGPKANSLFGMAIRNPAGKAQPVIYALLPGTASAKLNKGEKHQIGLVYILYPGDWQKGTEYLLSSIFHYRTERENARVSLNTTLDNMLAFAMNDTYSGWNETLKASNYQFDVPGTVKNVSALHPLSLAVITGNDTILRRRALPVIEYVMSREKFLYTTSDTPHQAQQPSHFLKGPCVDIGELGALHAFTQGLTPAFSLEANRLFGKSRQLNMNTETGGGSWQDYLARYRMVHQPGDLQKAIEGANGYLKQVYDRYSHTFFDTPGLRDKGAGFTTDYGYRIYDLFELYIETKNDLYLQAALTGARQLLLWTRSNPAPPLGNIVVNKNNEVKGIFPGRRASAVEGSPFVPMDETTHLPQQEIPAWQTSLNGLIPEAPNTYMFGPVMLAHHAPWLLRLAHFSGDTLLRNAAYNAIIGRYANFPGYYFTSLHTDVYQQADYPLHPFHDIKYNAIFYNHVWPHLAILMDFLVSDFYYRSKGRIDFPGTYAPGYAFLTSQVYGASKGTVMGNSNVQLWMPARALQSTGIALNYLMGHNEQDVFIAFANTAKKNITEQITLNKDVIRWEAEKSYPVVVYDNNGKATSGVMKNGMLTVTLPANGLTCMQIKDLYPKTEKVTTPTVSNKNRFIRTATTTAMIIQPNTQLAVYYVYCNKTEKEWKQCTLHYRINDDPQWTTVTDTSYPFEFDLPLAHTNDSITFEITAVQQDGNTISYPVQMINNDKKKITILGLGDSITEGGPNFFSYLFPLDSLLKQAGYQPEFIGPRRSIQNGDTISHSGFSGKTAEYLAKQIDSIYTAFPADVVLLHSGHNHFNTEAPIAGIIKAQQTIIATIKKKNSQALILVAGVITSGKLPKYDYIPVLDKAIKVMVDSLHDASIIFVDQQQDWDWDKYTIDDKVHPNRTGASIIANNWFHALNKKL